MEFAMQHDDAVKLRRRWRRKELAELWRISDRSIDRMRKDGRLGPPLYPGGSRFPLWTDEQREAAERAEPFSVAQSA
jgi:hypothetical protein